MAEQSLAYGRAKRYESVTLRAMPSTSRSHSYLDDASRQAFPGQSVCPFVQRLPSHRLTQSCSAIARYMSAVGALTLAMSFGACHAASPPKDPTETLRAYAEALEAGRVDEAYGLLSDDAKRDVSLDAYRRMATENPAEIREIAHALTRPSSPPVVTASISTPSGETLPLIYQSGRWKIDGSAIDLYAQNTPRQAITAFVRAFERHRFDVLMRFVPDSKKAGLDAAKLKEAWDGAEKQEMERLVQAVKSALPTAAFEEVGDRATMPFGAVGTVQMVREHGVWKIEDFD